MSQAALQASPGALAYKGFGDRLQAAGKSIKAALIATARKHIVTIDTMLATATGLRPMLPI